MRVRYLGQRDTDEERAAGKGERGALRERRSRAFAYQATGGGTSYDSLPAGACTGMRRGEIVRLTEKMIDKRGRRIDLPAAVTKGDKARTVFLSDAALSALDLWKIRGTGRRAVPGHTVELGSSASPCASGHVSASRRKLDDFHFHDLRHCFSARW